MKTQRSSYAKFLAFLQLSNSVLYRQLAQNSSKSEVVEAKLVCANNAHDFHALIFSDGRFAQGDRFDIEFEAVPSEISSWDWRWVFALNIHYQDLPIFPLNFQQQVIAVPPGVRALSPRFFERLMSEFGNVINQWVSKSTDRGQAISHSYDTYIDAMNTR